MPARPDETCWTVIRAAASGDGDARSAFTRGYHGVVREFLAARWRGRPLAAEVDDAVQEVFVESLKPGGVLEHAEPSRGEFRGLLYGVARNVARRFEKLAVSRGRLRTADSAWLQALSADEAGQATIFDRSWAHEMVLRAKALQRQRAESEGEAGRRRIELLERRFGDDQAIRQIALAWGVDAREVHNAYRRARGDFYRCLRDVVAFHAPADADLDDECRKVLDRMK